MPRSHDVPDHSLAQPHGPFPDIFGDAPRRNKESSDMPAAAVQASDRNFVSADDAGASTSQVSENYVF